MMLSNPPLTPSQLEEVVLSYPNIDSPASFASEYERWFRNWTNDEERAKVVSDFAEAYQAADSDLFPGIHAVMKISATRPSSTAGNERAFSAMKRLKTYMRSTMTTERLNGLAMLHIHQDRQVNIDQVIDQFSKLGPHRLAFL